MIIGAHVWGEDIEQSRLLFALKNAALAKPANKIILFTDCIVNALPQNCMLVNFYPKPKNKLLLYYWYKYKLPKLLLKYNISLFISNAGMLSSGNAENQFLFVENKNLLEERNNFFKKKFNAAVLAAQGVFVTNDILAASLNKKFPDLSGKIYKLYFNVNENNTVFTLNDIEAIKEKYTAGFQYYLFRVNASSQAHLTTVLKSFSQLKKWQKTSLRLILLFENEIDEKLLPDFKNYKYKNEVVLVKETKENTLSFTAAAFAYVFFGDYKSSKNVYNAFSYNIPVIAADTISNNLLFKLAVTYAAINVDSLALQLQLIYKNESYKIQLLQKANMFLTRFNSNTASQKFVEIISN
jgi:hypothetical protein